MRESDVKDKIDLLDEADSYLSFINKPQQYDFVGDKEFAFRSLITSRRKLSDPDEKKVYTEVCYRMMDSQETGRLYGFFKEIQKVLPKIIDPLTKALPSTKGTSRDTQKVKPKTVSLLSSKVTTSRPLPDFSHKDATKIVKQTVSDVLEGQRAKRKESHSSTLPLKKVKDARDALQQALDVINAKSLITGMKDCLVEIITLVTGLQRALRKLH
jgi:hypothetical protein